MTQISQISPDLIRRCMLHLAATHNERGIHACFRPLRTFLYWVESGEIMPAGWRNPIRKVKAPRLLVQPLDPVSIYLDQIVERQEAWVQQTGIYVLVVKESLP